MSIEGKVVVFHQTALHGLELECAVEMMRLKGMRLKDIRYIKSLHRIELEFE